MTSNDKNATVSVIRLASPTPSMASSKSSEKVDDDEADSMSDDSSRSIQNSEDDEERDTKRGGKKKSKVPSISLTLESFYDPEQAIQFAEEIMSTLPASLSPSPTLPPNDSLSIADVAGITNPRQLKIDYEHLRYVIENDHCYTPLTYSDSIEATSMKKSSRKIDSRAVSIHTAHAQPTTKKTINSLIGNKSQTGKSTEKDIGSASRSQNQNDSIETSGDRSSEGEEAESEADFSDFSESESDNDRDSDLDFSVNDLHSRRSVKKRRKRKAKKMAAKKRREKETIDAGTSEGDTTANSRRRSYASKRDLSVDNSAPAETGTPKTPRMKMGIKGPRDQSADDATPSPAPKPKMVKQVKTITPKVAEKKSTDVLMGDMTSLFSSPDIIKKVGSGPSGSAALSTPVNVTATPVAVTHRLLNGSQPQFRKKINQIQVKLASEQDKQLDLIDSLVQEELKRDSVSASIPATSSSSPASMSSSFISENPYIPSIMKMLETSVPESATADSIKVESSSFEADQFLPDELLEGLANDDCLTEDLLKDVAKLAEDKNLQELIDQQVLAIAKPPLVVVQQAVRRERPQKAAAPSAGSDPQVVINPPKPHASVITATVTTANSKQEPIKIIRSGGRIITLPPIEAPTTRGAKRRAEIPPTSDAQTSKKPIILNSLIDLNATATSKGLTFLGDVKSEPKERRASVQSAKRNSTETPKRTLSVENSMLANAFDDDDDYDDGSDGSYNSEDDPLRYEIIYVY